MKIGPNFEISADRYNVIVTEWVIGKDKQGNAKRHPRESYHATLEQARKRVLERLGDDALGGSLSEVIAAIARAQAAICEAVNGQPHPTRKAA